MSTLRDYYLADTLSWIHLLKVLIALAIGFIVVTLIHEPHSRWIIITITVVMMFHQSVGFQGERAIARALGTVTGAALGAIVIQLPQVWWLSFVLFLLVSAGFLVITVLRPKWKYMSLLGIITFTMITITASPSMEIAVERPLEILTGIVIALLVSVFIRPIRSSTILENLYHHNWQLLKDWVQFIITEQRHRHEDEEVDHLESSLRGNFEQQRALLKGLDLRRSHQQSTYEHQIIMQMGIFRYLVLIEIVQRQSDAADAPVILGWGGIADQLLVCFNALAKDQDIVSAANALGGVLGELQLRTLPQATTTHPDDAAATIRYALSRIHVILSDKLQR